MKCEKRREKNIEGFLFIESALEEVVSHIVCGEHLLRVCKDSSSFHFYENIGCLDHF